MLCSSCLNGWPVLGVRHSSITVARKRGAPATMRGSEEVQIQRLMQMFSRWELYDLVERKTPEVARLRSSYILQSKDVGCAGNQEQEKSKEREEVRKTKRKLEESRGGGPGVVPHWARAGLGSRSKRDQSVVGFLCANQMRTRAHLCNWTLGCQSSAWKVDNRCSPSAF
jgi:hypothetical protein